MLEIPRIDIAPFRKGNDSDKARVAREFGAAFKEIGFATIVGHGVPADVIRRTYDTAHAFFALPLQEKMAATSPARVKTRGYLPVGVESVGRTRNGAPPHDLCESLVFSTLQNEVEHLAPGTISTGLGNIVPANPPELYRTYRSYYLAVHDLVHTLMRISAVALDLPEDYFAAPMANMRGTLRTVLYPDQPEEPQPGQLRYNTHTDYGGFTVLRQDDAPGGLQACSISGEWIDVMPTPDSFVVNAGDLIARWTNDRWRSSVHRVVNPPRDAKGSTKRLSLVFFSNPRDDALIECLPTCTGAGRPAKYPPVHAGEYVMSKLSASMPAEMGA
jgi:isopenicillin N synthase-like dioxygenase